MSSSHHNDRPIFHSEQHYVILNQIMSVDDVLNVESAETEENHSLHTTINSKTDEMVLMWRKFRSGTGKTERRMLLYDFLKRFVHVYENVSGAETVVVANGDGLNVMQVWEILTQEFQTHFWDLFDNNGHIINRNRLNEYWTKDGIGCLLTWTLCLLSSNKVLRVPKNFPLTISASIRIYAKYIKLDSFKIEEPEFLESSTIYELYDNLGKYIKMNTREDYHDFPIISTYVSSSMTSLIPPLLLTSLLKNISSTPDAFRELFIQSSEWKKLILTMQTIISENMNYKLYILFCNNITSSMGNFFRVASTHISLLNFVGKIIPDLLTFISDKNLTSENRILCKLFFSECLVFSIFWSLHVLPSAFLEFEICDGYNILQELCLDVVRESDYETTRFSYEKMLGILSIMICLVMPITKPIQKVQIIPAKNDEYFIKKKCEKNIEILSIYLTLYKTSPSLSLLSHILTILNLCPDEYLTRLNVKFPDGDIINILCDSFDDISVEMREKILSTFFNYLKMFSSFFVEDGGDVNMICRDVNTICNLFLKKTPRSVVMICDMFTKLLSTPLLPSLQKMLRISGFTGIILRALRFPHFSRNENEDILLQFLDILQRYIFNHEKNHADLVNSLPSAEIFLSLMTSERLIASTLQILNMVIISDTYQLWKFIIGDIITLLSSWSDSSPIGLSMCDSILTNFEIIFSENPSTLQTFGELQGFEMIVRTLNFVSALMSPLDTLYPVMKTILHLLTISLQTSENISHMKKNITFSALLEPLHTSNFISSEFGERLTDDLFSLSTMNWKKKSSVNTLYNPEVIPEILLPIFGRNLELVDRDLSESFFSKLKNFCKISRNVNKLTHCGTVEVLIREFQNVILHEHFLQEDVIELFLILAKHCFSVSEIQLYFSFFFNLPKLNSLKIFPDCVIEALLDLTDEKFEPNYYIDFPSIDNDPYSLTRGTNLDVNDKFFENSSIFFPSLYYASWPPLKGYSTTVWFKIESLGNDDIFIFNVSTRDNFILNYFVSKNLKFGIKLTSKDITSSREIIFEEVDLVLNHWYFLVVNYCQLQEKNNSIKNNFVIYLDGDYKGYVAIEYQDTTYLRSIQNVLSINSSSLQSVSLGSKMEKSKKRKSFFRPKSSQPESNEKKREGNFQIGNMYIIEDCMTDMEVYIMYYLGPNYIGTFECCLPYISREAINSKRQEIILNNEMLNNMSERVLLVFSAKDLTVSSRSDSIGDDNPIMISKSAQSFSSMETRLTGNSELISRTSLKSNLSAIGGISVFFSFLYKMDEEYYSFYSSNPLKRETHKIIILEIFNNLISYNAPNNCDMVAIDGYDLLNNLFLQRKFPISDSILLSLVNLTGISIPHKQIIEYNFSKKKKEIENLLSKGVINNFIAFEKLLLDDRIFEDEINTRKNLFEILYFLVSKEHPSFNFHINIYHTTNTLNKLLYTLSQHFLNKKTFSKILIRPFINTLRAIGQPSPIKFLFAIGQYLILTHPPRGVSVWEAEDHLIRTKVLDLFLEFIIVVEDDLILDLNLKLLPISLLIALLSNASSSIRTILLKMIGVYITRREALKEYFRKNEMINLITEQLKDFNDPSISEFQVLFDLLLGSLQHTRENIEELEISVLEPTPRLRTQRSISNIETELDRDVKHYRSNTISNLKIKKSKKQNETKMFKALLVSPVDSFKFPEFLYTIFQLIPVVKSPYERLHILETLHFLFRFGSNTTKKSYVDVNTHLFLHNLINQDDDEFLTSCLEFLIDYLNFNLFIESRVEFLNFGMTLENSIFGWRISRKILHGILVNFFKEHLSSENKNEKKKKFKLDTLFATYIAHATDVVLQWNEPLDYPKAYESFIINEDHNISVEDFKVIDDYMTSTNELEDRVVIESSNSNINSVISSNLVKSYPSSRVWHIFERRSQRQKKFFDFFHYKLEDLNGFVFWLMEAIRLCLQNRSMKRGGLRLELKNFAEILLGEQIKRIILYLVDGSRSTEENIFGILTLLYFYPLETDLTMSKILEGQDLPVECGKILEEFCSDEKFIKKLIFLTVKLFLKNDEFLTYLITKIWGVISLSGKNYLKNSDFFVLEKQVEGIVKDWEMKENQDLQNKFNKKIAERNVREKNEDRAIKSWKAKLRKETIKLEEFQLSLIKPTLSRMKKQIDQDILSQKQHSSLLQKFQSPLNVFNFHKIAESCPNPFLITTEMEINGQLERSHFKSNSYENVIKSWKLDTTSGPNRVRMKLRKQHPRVKSENLDVGVQVELPQIHVSSSSPSLDQTITQFDHRYHGTTEQLIAESKQCIRITPLRKCSGELLFGESNVFFIGKEYTYLSGKTETETRSYSFSFDMIREVHPRRYMLKNSALEIFLTNGKSMFLTFDIMADRDTVLLMLSGDGTYKINLPQLNLPNLVDYETEVNGKFITKKSITQKWREGLISNFEYLMHLNTLAGRSFNDLTQYPVLPYILSDYTSDELDLNNPQVYRDLSKPMGALDQNRLLEAMDKYEGLKQDEEHPPYHWGTLYSTPMAVLIYLVRLEPFTRCFYEINGQRLDVPDRTFHDIKKSWDLSSRLSKSDVKELTPEFYYLPEFLENKNRIDFGVMQNDNYVDDVVLPPWAKNSPVLFVRKMREALESKHVSMSIHYWIDLIFGYKQVGEEAVKSCNVFHCTTYEGSAEDIDLISDPMIREARQTQIFNCGQTPKQLFKRPHVERYSVNESISLSELTSDSLIVKSVKIFLKGVGDIYMTMDSGLHGLVAVGEEKIFIPAPNQEKRKSPLFLSFAHWDKTIRVCRWDNHNKPIHIFHFMNQPESYTCLRFSKDGKYFVIGTSMSVVHLFKLNNQYRNAKSSTSFGRSRYSDNLNSRYIDHITSLFGHSGGDILDVFISTEFSVIVSACVDGNLIVWDLNRLTHVRSIRHDSEVTCVTMSESMGDILSFSGNTLYLRNINGELIRYRSQFISRVACMKYVEASTYNKTLILCGLMNGSILILGGFDLTILSRLSIADYISPITCLCINSTCTEIVSGDNKGMVVTWGRP